MRIQQINHLPLFKFTDELGDRLQTLLDKKKSDTLTSTENLEIDFWKLALTFMWTIITPQFYLVSVLISNFDCVFILNIYFLSVRL